tara:strand:+ start:95292 stop:95471 length:180 start_codon:yes stop_codon:yes gene_type:complete
LGICGIETGGKNSIQITLVNSKNSKSPSSPKEGRGIFYVNYIPFENFKPKTISPAAERS